MTPENVPLTARRNVPFLEEYAFAEDGDPFDLTGCTAAMQVRLYGAAPGGALITLANVASNIEGVWISDPADGVLQVRIDEATLAGLPDAAEAGASAVFAYDLVVTWGDGLQETFLEGSFTLLPGVTA